MNLRLKCKELGWNVDNNIEVVGEKKNNGTGMGSTHYWHHPQTVKYTYFHWSEITWVFIWRTLLHELKYESLSDEQKPIFHK